MSEAQHGNSRYSAQIAAAICWQLAQGKSLRAICLQDGSPDQKTVYRWIETKGSFRQQYARAREIQAHGYADEIVEISDTCDETKVEKARLRVDARKWTSAKLLPKVYGDKLLHTGADGQGPIEHRLALNYDALEPEELVLLKRLLEKAMPRKLEAIEGELAE